MRHYVGDADDAATPLDDDDDAATQLDDVDVHPPSVANYGAMPLYAAIFPQ